jgi:hypothetical protein
VEVGSRISCIFAFCLFFISLVLIMLFCYVCNNGFANASLLATHMKHAHNFTVSSQYICKQGNCLRNFQSLYSFKRHLNTQHRGDFAEPPVIVQIIPNPGDEIQHHDNVPFEPPVIEPNIENEVQLNPEIGPNEFSHLIQNSSSAYMAKLYDNSKITRSQIQSIVCDTSEFLASGFVNILKDKVLRVLPQGPEHHVAVSEIEQMFTTLENPFQGLETEYCRMKYFESNSFFVAPQSYVIGERVVQETILDNIVLTTKTVTGQFIPLRKTLKCFFELPEVLNKTLQHYDMEFNSRAGNVISNFVQGELWQNVLLTTPAPNDSIKFPLFIYFDDFEISNALGAAAGKHKLGGLYCNIPVIPPEFQSQLENIFVAMLFRSSDRAKFHNRATFDILINELTFLETEGIIVNTEIGPKRMCFIMCLLLGDNLGLHSLLGFVESFRANFCCRFCKAPRDLAGQQLYEDAQLLRSELTYDADVDMDDVSLTGVKERCIWNDLPSFHCVKNFTCDVMHDLFEGVCKYDMSKIIFYFVYDVKIVTLETLNCRIQYFNYGSTEVKNKPAAITKLQLQRNTLHQSASQTLCLVRYFCVMMGDLIPEGNEVWELYLLLRQIIDIATDRSLQKGCEVLLGTLVAEHHELYIRLFKEPLKPKFHHLIHYPRLVSLVGPLVHLSSMRDEAKHKEAKIAAHVTTSRRDIAFTLAFKNQLKFCYRLMSGKGFVSNIAFGIAKDASELATYGQFLPILPDCLRANSRSVTWVKYRSIWYKKGNVLIVRITEDLPQFAIIKELLIAATGTVYFIVSFIQTVGIVEHLHSYQVRTLRDEWACLQWGELLSNFPLDMHTLADGMKYVCLRHPV